MTEEDRLRGTTGTADGFELIVGPADGVIQNADVPVRWCVTNEGVQALERAGVKNPYVVLATSSKYGNNEWRTIVPLGDMLVYARFYQAGTQRIFAVIVDAGETPEEIKKTERAWMNKEFGAYDFWMQNEGRAIHDTTKPNILAATDTSVIVPDGVFGKEPPAWMKWYVNLFHGQNKVDDQCEFRRRAILAFTLKWIPVAVWTMFYTIACTLILAITVGGGYVSWITNWKAALHPWIGHFGMIDNDEGEYQDLRDSKFIVWIPWKDDDGRREKAQPVWALTMISPLMVSIYAAITYLFVNDHGEYWWFDWHEATAYFALVMVGIVGCVDIGTTIAYYVHKKGNSVTDHSHSDYAGMGAVIALLGWGAFLLTTSAPWWVTTAIGTVLLIAFLAVAFSDAGRRAVNAIFDFMDRVYIRLENLLFGNDVNDFTEIRELLCPQDHENLTTDIKSIPKERRTWRLRFHAFKQKVCKPMQR